MEALRTNRWLQPRSILGGIAIGALVTIGVQAIGSTDAAASYRQAYETSYTRPDGCLRNIGSIGKISLHI